MATFSENQVRHLFVEKSLKSGKLAKTDPVGTIAPMADKEKTSLWFGFMGAGNNMVASDKITIANIVSAKATSSDKMIKTLKRVKITVAEEALSEGNIIAGQDYILRLAFDHYIGMSEENQYWKYGMVHGYAKMTKDAFYKALALSLVKNLSRDENQLVKVYVHSASLGASHANNTFDTKFNDGFMEVNTRSKDTGVSANTNPYYVNSATYVNDIDSIEIEAVMQPWSLGTISQETIPFEAQPLAIRANGDDVVWGDVVASEESTKIENGCDIADLEYFCMGERGDIYRNVGWPYTIKTEYLVDPSKKYDVLDIVYFYAGPNEDVQKSQKTLTIVVENDSHAKMNALIGRIKTVSGVNITTL